MNIEIVKIGKCRHPGITDSATEYIKRLKPYLNIETILWKEGDVESRLERLLHPEVLIIALDERGKQWSSMTLSKNLSDWLNSSRFKKVVFVIGGPYGLSEHFRKKSAHVWSLSDCTLPSDFSWLIVCEQIYRAFTILKGMAYHHE